MNNRIIFFLLMFGLIQIATAQELFLQDDSLPSLPPTDAEILKSLDNLKKPLDDEIFTIEQQQTITELEEEISMEALDDLDSFILEEALAAEDMALLTEDFSSKEISTQPKSSDKQDKLPFNKQPKIISNMQQQELKTHKHGVGINGNEEAIINTLDQSDLMDYLEDEDLWLEDLTDEDIDNNFEK